MKHQKNNFLTLTILAAIALGVFFFATADPAQALNAPTVLAPKDGYTLPPDTPLTITGLVANGTEVLIFVDGKIIGGVKAKNGKLGTASFAFRTTKAFAIGNHTLQVIARTKTETSPYTGKQTLTIPKLWPRRIDGVIVEASKANLPPVAVMIENLVTVRPQFGLAAASVVYETLAEGGIPRFLAIFARDDMARVGPVRSARPYYVGWAKEYLAALLHAGGSLDAFQEFGKLKVRSIDALVNKTARYFFRGGKIETTHNLFTKNLLLKNAKKDFKLETAKALFESWKFKDDPELAKRPNQNRQLIIDFRSGSSYIVAYKYDRASNGFLRFNGGRPHFDASYNPQPQIKVKNVVVQLIEKEKVIDRQKHLALQITGSGRGWFFQDGKLHQITWKKPKIDSRTRFYFLNGKEVEFNRGNTWIEVVPKDRLVLFK